MSHTKNHLYIVSAELLKLVSIIRSGLEPNDEDLRQATLICSEALAYEESQDLNRESEYTLPIELFDGVKS